MRKLTRMGKLPRLWSSHGFTGNRDMVLKKGDLVKKIEGYPFPGQVVAVFKTLAGQQRVVVECTAPAVRGCLHIYNPLQLRAVAVHNEKARMGLSLVPGGRAELLREDMMYGARVTHTKGKKDGEPSRNKKRASRPNGTRRKRGNRSAASAQDNVPNSPRPTGI